MKHFEKFLHSLCGIPLEILINDNRSSIVSFLGKNGRHTKVSIHRMFLTARREVLEALADFILKKRLRKAQAVLRDYIHENLPFFDYTQNVSSDKLTSKGKNHDLQKIYSSLNERYFSGRLRLRITWFGNSSTKPKSQMTFGLYHEPLKLIKVHRLLDTENVPKYFLEYVIYHEMLHEVFPPYTDESGRHRIHTKEFKEKEKSFPLYEQAKGWERKNRLSFFK